MGIINASAIAHVAVEVADLDRARNFYARVLGTPAEFAPAWDDAGAEACRLASGQHLILVPSEKPRTFTDTGAHVAYRAAPKTVAGIIARAEAAGIAVHRYVEDRPAEVTDNVYLADPYGNRIQLVADTESRGGPAGGVAGIDHAAVLVSDIEWEDEFWVDTLGVPAVHRVGWNTGDFARARAWGEGKENMAPGTRRWDQRYRDIPGARPGQGRKVARPNPQLFLDFGGTKPGHGSGPVFGIFLAQAHFQEPPPDQAHGTPRVALRVADDLLDSLASALARAGGRVEGPVVHGAAAPIRRSFYLRDSCGIFFEFCSTF
jgi:catechol 2,3-dioxygenase-like lactoylglutathione lyase family enzyme